MNELIQLLGLVADDKKTEAQTLGEAIKAKIGELDAKVTQEERLKLDAIASRDSIKGQLKNIATGLGVDAENVVEAIEAIKTQKGGSSEVKDKEIEQLKKEIATLTTQLSETTQKTSKEILAMELKNQIAMILPRYKPKTNGAPYIISAIEKQAVFEGGKVMFKNTDGTTLRINGNDATVEDMIKQMQEAEKASNEGMFFNIEVQSSGATGGGGAVAKGDFIP